MGVCDQDVADVTEKLAAAKHLVPNHLWGGILNHVLEGRSTGSFLTALFANDFAAVALGAGCDITREDLHHLALFLHNNVPWRCWRSHEIVNLWRERGGIRGGAHHCARLVELD